MYTNVDKTYSSIVAAGKQFIVFYESAACKGGVGNLCQVGYRLRFKPVIDVYVSSMNIVKRSAPFYCGQIIITDVDAENGKEILVHGEDNCLIGQGMEQSNRHTAKIVGASEVGSDKAFLSFVPF